MVDGGVCTDLAKDKFVALAGGLRPDPEFANSKPLVDRLRNATGIFLGARKPGRIAQRYLGTQHKKTAALSPDRGGVILGCSAGSIILGSFIVSGVSAS